MRSTDIRRPIGCTPTAVGRGLSIGVPAVIVGSLALSLTAMPAAAVEVEGATAFARTPRDGMLPTTSGARTETAGASRVHVEVAPATYTVVRGDTISAIAGRFSLRTADVLALNGLTRASVIYPGQTLRLVGIPVAAAPVAAVTSPTVTGAYTVVAGDTISAIARGHSTTIQALLDANGLTRASIIYPGQSLAIPGAAAAPAAQPSAAPAPAAAAPHGPASAYTVVDGDTISGIARRNDTTTRAVLDANGLSSTSIIYPGQTIAIPSPTMVAAASVAPIASAATTTLDAEQTANVQLIIRVGRSLGVPDRGIAIALGTAMQESWLRNLDWGDRDSLGLFQQRPSAGWGSAEQILDSERATRVFFGGSSDPNGRVTRGLLDVPGWESMSFADAAQAVQISAYPDRYAQWEQPAGAWLAAWG